MNSEKEREDFKLVDSEIGFLRISLSDDKDQDVKGTAHFENLENSLVFDLPILERESTEVDGKVVIELSGHNGSTAFISSMTFNDKACKNAENGGFTVISRKNNQKFISHRCEVNPEL